MQCFKRNTTLSHLLFVGFLTIDYNILKEIIEMVKPVKKVSYLVGILTTEVLVL